MMSGISDDIALEYAYKRSRYSARWAGNTEYFKKGASDFKRGY